MQYDALFDLLHKYFTCCYYTEVPQHLCIWLKSFGGSSIHYTLCCISLRRCWFGLETRVIIKILTHPFYPLNLDWFSWVWSKKNQNGRLKKIQFRQFSIFFCESFRDWFLGEWVKLMPGALMWLHGCQAVRRKAKSSFFVFLACFKAYIRQPDNHLGWAISMSLILICLNHPRTNPWNFLERILRIGGVENLTFLVVHFCLLLKVA